MTSMRYTRFPRPAFTADIIRSGFIPEIEDFTRCLLGRLLPGFATVAEEADEVERRAQKRTAWGEDIDEASAAESAFDKGLDHFIRMRRVEQGVINLFAAGLYHAFEQQLAILYRQEITWDHEQRDPQLDRYPCCVVSKRLRTGGIDVCHINEWDLIQHELRRIANTVKHADGTSCKELQQRRPDLFENPDIRGLGKLGGPPLTPSLPLIGEGLYVEPQQLKTYADAIVRFWEQVAEMLDTLASGAEPASIGAIA